METTTTETRSHFAQWAIERSRAIVADHASDLAGAGRDCNDKPAVIAVVPLSSAVPDAVLEMPSIQVSCSFGQRRTLQHCDGFLVNKAECAVSVQ